MAYFFKNISFIIFNFKFLKKIKIFFSKGSFLVVYFLVFDISSVSYTHLTLPTKA